MGTHTQLYLQETEAAARVTLFKSYAQGPQSPNILPWLWKEIKPTGLGRVGGAGGALGFTRNSDWGRWIGSYRKGNRKNTGGILQLSWRVRPTGASPMSAPMDRGPSRQDHAVAGAALSFCPLVPCRSMHHLSMCLKQKLEIFSALLLCLFRRCAGPGSSCRGVDMAHQSCHHSHW